MNNTITETELEISSENNQETTLNTSDMYTFQKGDYYKANIICNNGSTLLNQTIIFNINGVNYTKTTDFNGVAKLKINLNPGNYIIKSNYKGISNVNTLFIRDVPTVFIKEEVSNNEIQKIIDNAYNNSTIEFLGNCYDNVALTVKKSLNIISYCGTILHGNKIDPIFKISSSHASHTKISGFCLSESSDGIFVLDSTNVNIINNDISRNKNGITLKNAKNTLISNNSINNNFVSGIILLNAFNSNITNNIINKNYEGIYFDRDNQHTFILNNTINFNKNYAVNLDLSGFDSDIFRNNISSNVYAIKVNTKANNLNIKYNTITWNLKGGVFITEDYVKTKDDKDFIFEDNALLYNFGYNLEAKDSQYEEIGSLVFGNNWVGTDDKSFTSICPKIKMGFYKFHIKQIDPSSFEVSIGFNNSPQSSLAPFGLKMSFDRGTTYGLIDVSNGKAIINVSNSNGNVVIKVPGSDISLTLDGYVPYKPTINPEIPSNSNNDNLTNSPNTLNTKGNVNTNTVNTNKDSLDVGSGSNKIEEIGKSQDIYNDDSKFQTSQKNEIKHNSQHKESVAKILNIDEKSFRVNGIGLTVILIILIILLYYSKDIKILLKRRKDGL